MGDERFFISKRRHLSTEAGTIDVEIREIRQLMPLTQLLQL